MTLPRRLPDGHEIDHDRSRIDWSFVHAALAGTYWASDRDPHLTERAAHHALNFGVYAPSGDQVGYARVMTDFTFRAHIADLVIATPVQSRGLATALIETILSHPDLRSVEKWTLVTADAEALYRRLGFRPVHPEEGWMTRGKAG